MDICCQCEGHLRDLAGPGILNTVECCLGWLHSHAGHILAAILASVA